MKALFILRTVRYTLGILYGFLFLAVAGGTTFAGQHLMSADDAQPPALPVPSVLVSEADKSGAAMHRHIKDYTYTLKKTVRTLNEQAAVDNEDVREFEAYPVRGEHVLIQVSQDGKPLPAWQIARQRRDAGENLEKAEKEESKHAETNGESAPEVERYIAAAVYAKYRGKLTYISITPTALLRACDFSSPRFERLGGRDVVVLDFRAQPGVVLPAPQAYIGRLRGTVWIDVKDKVLTRLVGWSAALSGKLSGTSESLPESAASIIYEQTKLPTGDWFPTLIRMNATSDLSVFNGLPMDVVFEFSDYKNFKTASDDFKPTDKEQPPDNIKKPEAETPEPVRRNP